MTKPLHADRRRGFTLVELLVSALVGTLLLMAAYQVLITNRRAYSVQNERIEAQQATRAAMDVLFAELREISPQGGDILDMEDSKLEVRVMRGLGVVCGVDLTLLIPRLRVRSVTGPFATGDSVFVFADNEVERTSDDTWVNLRITNTDDVTCSGGQAQDLYFTGQLPILIADSVRTGAAVRSFTRFTYGLMTYGGQIYLGRRENNDDWVPLVGPLRDADTGAAGIDFEYRDEFGNVTNVPAEVREITVTARTWSDVTDASGDHVLDTLSASIYTRN